MLQVMKRRRFMATIATASALPVGLAAQQTPGRPAGAVASTAPLQLVNIDDAADAQPEFFSPQQFATLTRLSDLLVPKIGDFPGALDAGAPAFLDFLIGESPTADQLAYTAGLDALNYAAATRFDKPFADVDESQASELLAVLREPWSPVPSTDPLVVFLHRAKADVRTATVNTQAWAVASAAQGGGGRRRRGAGQYWTTVE